ncbi:GYF domain-containing protein [Ditylenchus destructor]|nr:GYF domain-containing protein [Ditylenchus destructor]
MSTDSNSQVNFNPSWMQPAAPLKNIDRPNGLINRPASEDADASQEMMDPVFAKNRYGREDLLALMGKVSTKPPDGLEQCPFFMEKPQTPIILLALNDTEQRLQQNINSSKALSALSRQDRQNIAGNGAEVGSPSSGGNSGWITAGSNRGGGGNGMSHGHKPAASRWSALAPAGNSNEGQSFRTSRGGGTQSSFNKSSRPPHGDHRSTGVSRYRTPSTNADTQVTSTPSYSENVAKILDSQASHAPPAPANIWAKIGMSVKNENEKPTTGAETERPAFTAQTSADDWLKFKPGLGDESQHPLLYSSNKATNILDTLCGPDSTGPSMETQPQTSPSKPTQQQQKLHSISAPGGVQQPEKIEWFYLDPSSIQRGPFETHQMQGWYEGGYFDASLRLRRGIDKDFITLGELYQINGSTTPFNYNLDVTSQRNPGLTQNFTTSLAEAPIQMSSNLHHSPRIDAAASIWTSLSGNLDNRSASTATSTIAADFSAILSEVPTGVNRGMKSPHDIELENAFLMKQRLMEEEKMKLKEKEEQLRREEREREEKHRRMQEMEMELRRKEEELQRISREKEQELMNKQRQMAEFERQRMEALQLMEQKLRNDHLEQQRRKEEEQRRREQEIEERLQQERERQRLLLEAESQRKREEETKIRMAYEEARRLQFEALEVARRAEEEQRRRLQEENQARVRKDAEEAKAAKDAERRRKKQEKEAKEAEERRQQELEKQRREEDELNRAAIEAILSSSPPPKSEKAPPAPWVTVGGTKTAAKKPSGSSTRKEQDKQAQPLQKTLLEIQQEEEHRAMEEKMIKQKEMLNAHCKNTQEPRHTTQKSAWGAPPQTYQMHAMFSDAPPLPTNSTQQFSTSGTRSWNSVPTTQPVPIPKANNAKSQPQKNQKKQKVDIKLPDNKPKQPDAFTSWIIKRVHELNSSVDAEVFASFIEGLDSPNEAEDYIIGYLGESKVVKDFHREFLQKRIELRPRVQHTAKDDLSGPAAAAGLANFSSSTGAHNSGSNHNGNSSSSAAATKKKKKPTKGQGKVLLDGLGFRPAGDPNRVNAGEIDSAIPPPTSRKNR